MATKKKIVSKAAEVKSVETNNVVEKVAARKPADIIQEFSGLGIKVQAELSDISAKIADGRRQFDEVNQAIAARETRLADLFQIEAELLSLDEVKSQRLAAEEANDAYLAALEVERTREDNEYNYNLTRKRREDLDKYNDQVAAAKRSEEARRAELETDWDAREEAIASSEEELAALRTQVAGFPELVAKEVKKAEAILSNVLSKDHRHAIDLLAKDKQAADQIAAQVISSLKAELANAKSLADGLNLSLADARAEVKEIAAKALESAAGQQALAAMQSSLNSLNQGNGKGGR